MSNLTIQPIFATPLLWDVLDIDNKPIIDYIHRIKDQHEVSIYFDLDAPELQPLFSEIRKRLAILHKELDLVEGHTNEFHGAWATIGTNQYIAEPHCHNDHPYGVFSGVYYPQADETSHPLVLQNPNDMVSFVFKNWFNKGGRFGTNMFTAPNLTFPPKTGGLIIFPTYLTHYVLGRIGTSAENRISIAFNTSLAKR